MLFSGSGALTSNSANTVYVGLTPKKKVPLFHIIKEHVTQHSSIWLINMFLDNNSREE